MKGRATKMCRGQTRGAEKENKPRYSPDGCISAAWRLVRRGGWVKFAGLWRQHPALENYVDQNVWIDNTDYCYSEISAYTEKNCKVCICTMRLVDQPDGGRP